MDYSEEIKAYRASFAQVDIKNPAALKVWFHKHRHFSQGALAIMTGLTRFKLRKLRKLAGVQKKGQYNPPRNKQTQALHRLKACQQTYPPLPHACDNAEWLRIHFLEEANSAAACARLAGVNHNTMLEWLAKHGIVTPSNEQSDFIRMRKRAARTPLWFTELAGKLSKLDIVKKASIQELGMIIRFRSWTKEVYWAIPYQPKYKRTGKNFSLTKEMSRLEKEIPIHYQYPVEFGQPNYKHLLINRKDWDKASFIEQRLALHSFIRKQTELDLWLFQYPETEIEKCLQRFKKASTKDYIDNNIFLLHGKDRTSNKLWPIVFTCFTLRPELSQFFKSPNKILRVLNELTKKPGYKISTESMLRLACSHYGIKLKSPIGYRAIFEHLGLRSGATLLDLTPGIGSKAIACSLIGAKYRTTSDTPYDNASVYSHFDKRIGVDWDWHRGEPVDMVIADNNFRHVNIEYTLATYSKLAKRIICYVPAENRDEYEAQFKPKAIVGIRDSYHTRTISYLFVW